MNPREAPSERHAAIDSGTRPVLAIVGGGYVGSELAKALDIDTDVTPIERVSHFTHAPAMIRAMIDPSACER